MHRNLSFVGRTVWFLAIVSAGVLWGRQSASVWYVSQIMVHALSGGVLAVIWLRCGWRTLFKKDASWERLVGVLPLAAAVSGIAILFTGVSAPFDWVLAVHWSFSILTTAWIFIEALKSGDLSVKRELSVGILLFVVMAGWTLLPLGERDSIVNEYPGPLTFADNTPGGESSPFFPSPTSTPDQQLLDAEFFLESESCGRSGCHVDAVEQWSQSAHQLSSFNNQWYRKSIEYMQEVAGTAPSKWCAGCHDPALLLSGKMERPISELLEDPASHAGLACVSCHAIKEVRNTGGNGAYTIAVPTLHALATHKNPAIQFVHDRIMKLDPGPHKATFLKPMMVENQAAFCSSCHKVHLDKSINDYRWLRGFNTYDNWQASGVSGEGARSFYQPEKPIQCTDCHMPVTPSKDPGSSEAGMKDHRFIAANTAVSIAKGHSTQLEKTITFLENGHLTVDIFAVSPIPSTSGTVDQTLVRENDLSTTFAVGEEAGMAFFRGSRNELRKIEGDLASNVSEIEVGKAYRLDVVVRSRSIGHFFPTGTTDAQEAWLEVYAVDAVGRKLITSGFMDGNLVDSTAHFYRSVLIDGNANRIDKRNAFASRGAVYVNLIPPGAADVAHYVLDVPPDAVSPISISAKLNYRKFSQDYTAFAFGGTFSEPFSGHFANDGRKWTYTGVDTTVSALKKELPALPVALMAADSLKLKLSVGNNGEASVSNAGPLSKEALNSRLFAWNDFGIALLSEGDLSGALQAFERVTQIDPGYADGWINLARVYLSEGDYDNAILSLERANSVKPDYYKTTYFRGLYHKLNGDYSAAISAFLQVLKSHPKDRVVLNDLGRSYYLDEQLSESIGPFKQALLIDAEDLTAHYNLMLVYQALGDTEKAAIHQARYESFKADETSIALARKYRARHPSDNNEASAIHYH